MFSGLGHISSFSYFRTPEFAKDLDYRFVDAGRIITEQFHLHMTDHTGFPGNVRFRELDENAGKQKSKEFFEDKSTSSKPVLTTKISTNTPNKLNKSTSQAETWSSLSSGSNRNVKNRFLSQVS